ERRPLRLRPQLHVEPFHLAAPAQRDLPRCLGVARPLRVAARSHQELVPVAVEHEYGRREELAAFTAAHFELIGVPGREAEPGEKPDQAVEEAIERGESLEGGHRMRDVRRRARRSSNDAHARERPAAGALVAVQPLTNAPRCVDTRPTIREARMRGGMGHAGSPEPSAALWKEPTLGPPPPQAAAGLLPEAVRV